MITNLRSVICYLVVMIGAAVMFASPTSALQTAPYKVNFQGRLTDSTGNAKAAGSYNIKFRLMSASSGGSNLWQADRVRGASDYRITVTTGGLFTIQLGDTTLGDPALSPSIFNTQTNATVYLEVELPTPATATCSTNGCASFTEGAMTPRSLLGASAYAMNADTVDGIDSASLVQLSSNNTFTGTFLHKNGSDTTTAFQIQKADGTPLLVADTTNLALKVGGGDVSPDASPALFVLDYKNTSGDPTGTDGAMYYNSSSKKFRCYENGVWTDCLPATPTRYEYHSDFLYGGTSIVNGTTLDHVLAAGSVSGTFARVSGETNHPGIVRLGTGTSATGMAGISESFLVANTTNPIQFGAGAWAFTTQMRITTLSDGTNRFTSYNGFVDNQSNFPNTPGPLNGCYLKYVDNTNSGKWQGVCENADTPSTCDTGVTAAAGTWYTLKVAVNAAANLATFVVNDTSSCTVSTNIPTTNRTAFSVDILKSVGTTARTTDYDYIDVTGEGLVRN
jgi:hypothetical protein